MSSADSGDIPTPTPTGQTRIDKDDAESLLNLAQKLIRRDGSVDAKALRTFLSEHFSLEEMAQLCADLNIDFESIPGDTKDGKALELVQYCTRHGSLTDLAAVAIEARA